MILPGNDVGGAAPPTSCWVAVLLKPAAVPAELLPVPPSRACHPASPMPATATAAAAPASHLTGRLEIRRRAGSRVTTPAARSRLILVSARSRESATSAGI